MMERVDRFSCCVSMAIAVGISILTVWGYFQDTSLYFEVKTETAPTLSAVESAP